jgi:hypothetical protein
LGSRKKPDRVIRHGEERPHEVWRQPEALGNNTGFLGQAKNIFDNHAEALSPEPMK